MPYVFTYYIFVNRTQYFSKLAILKKILYSLLLRLQLSMYFRFAFLLGLFIMEKFGQNDSRLDMAKTFIIVATMCTIALTLLSAEAVKFRWGY